MAQYMDDFIVVFLSATHDLDSLALNVICYAKALHWVNGYGLKRGKKSQQGSKVTEWRAIQLGTPVLDSKVWLSKHFSLCEIPDNKEEKKI